MLIKTPGGGGYGPPAERATEAIEHDLKEGWISSQGAQAAYGSRAE